MMVGSLFAGIGGFDLAAERAGMTVVWQSENDAHASRVLNHHWPQVTNYGDVHGVESPPTVDVLCGGFPCQDYSVAGQRGGLAGDRGALWWQYHRLIDSIRPAWVVAENVPGLLSSKDGQDFETIITSLTECGYGVVWAVLDAQYFGVAQRRRRVFIVGHSGGHPRPEILALSEGLYGHPAPSRETGTLTTTALTAGLGSGGPDASQAQAGWLVPSLSAGRARGDHAGQEGQLIAFNARQDDAAPSEHVAGTLDGGHPVGAVAFAQNQRSELRELGDMAGALAAEPGVTQQTYVASTGVRRLTPLECERLQGFPDNWTHTPGNSDTQRYRQLGNAVAVPVAQWVFNQIVEAA